MRHHQKLVGWFVRLVSGVLRFFFSGEELPFTEPHCAAVLLSDLKALHPAGGNELFVGFPADVRWCFFFVGGWWKLVPEKSQREEMPC